MKLTREQFTLDTSQLVIMLNQKGILCIRGDANRSKAEQHRQFVAKKSKCDGTTIISAHQYEDSPGRYAEDYFLHLPGSTDINIKDLYIQAHQLWEGTFQGDPMIEWDPYHFQKTRLE